MTAPRSPEDPLNFELKKVEEDEKKDGTPSSSSEPVTPARTDCKGQQEKGTEVIPAEEKKKVNAWKPEQNCQIPLYLF